ncbi:hypothetical protein GGR50DRAFT_576163 [Xylaria sp. CBS 124048]|nr:hypothetical protein GGR50DRAFT_576163 [Xylaria sp. CBS 124048]
MASNGDPTMMSVGFLARANAYYRESRYPRAVILFEKVANNCPCGVPVKKTRCLCKSLLPAIMKLALDAELKKACICSAKSDVRCNDTSHINALDGLAAIYEIKYLVTGKATDSRADLAFVMAEAMINLAPRNSRGYLRLGKLQRYSYAFDTAYNVYQQGIEVVGKRNPSDPLLPALYQLRSKIIHMVHAKDPLKTLPLELVAMILKYTDFQSLCHCLGVSQNWNRLLTSNDPSVQSLWRKQEFGHVKYPIDLPLVRKYASYAGNRIEDLSSEETAWADPMAFLQHVLQAPAYRGLKALKLLDLRKATADLKDLEQTKLVKLSLSINRAATQTGIPRLPFNLLFFSAATLQEITFQSVRLIWPLPDLPNLRILRIYNPFVIHGDIIMPHFMAQAPNVEVVYFENAILRFTPEVSVGWPRLKYLYVGERVNTTNLQSWQLPSGLEELHLATANRVFDIVLNPTTYHVSWPKLRKLTFRLISMDATTDLAVELLKGWTKLALESGSLEYLGPGFFPTTLQEWFKSDHLKFLSFQGLAISVGIDPIAVDAALYQYMERFPNLDAIDAGSEPFSNGTLAKVILDHGIKRVYFQGQHQQRVELVAWSQKKGVDVEFIFRDSIRDLPMVVDFREALERPNRRYRR